MVTWNATNNMEDNERSSFSSRSILKYTASEISKQAWKWPCPRKADTSPRSLFYPIFSGPREVDWRTRSSRVFWDLWTEVSIHRMKHWVECLTASQWTYLASRGYIFAVWAGVRKVASADYHAFQRNWTSFALRDIKFSHCHPTAWHFNWDMEYSKEIIKAMYSSQLGNQMAQ